MNRTLTLALLLAALAAPAAASAAAPLAKLSDLAAITGLTERQVQMVVGGHTAYSEYLTSYEWARLRFVRALGVQRYEDLMAGREITLDDGQHFAVAAR